ncbi:hypothetical protein NI821_26830, partial [Escherichia coli]|uniref:hypothetical protein n=1 Tax=Escherichia coli TaxID=562 RepID=UPI00209B3F32
SDPGPVFHTIVSIKNDGHYFCRAGGNRPDGLNEPVTVKRYYDYILCLIEIFQGRYNTMGIIQFFQTQTKITIGYIISVTAFLF